MSYMETIFEECDGIGKDLIIEDISKLAGFPITLEDYEDMTRLYCVKDVISIDDLFRLFYELQSSSNESNDKLSVVT